MPIARAWVLCVLLPCLSACSSSPVLVQSDDAIFNSAQKRLLRTQEWVNKQQAPAPENALFMQAEGFFRYRFLPPSCGGKTFLAEAAAAAVAYPAYLGLKNRSVSFPMAALGIGGLIVLSFDYTSSYEDAQRGVVRWNERAESRFDATHPEAP